MKDHLDDNNFVISYLLCISQYHFHNGPTWLAANNYRLVYGGHSVYPNYLYSEISEEAAPYGFGVVMINMINIALLLSVNLGIMNLLPLPALDGGRLVFLLVEAVRGKPIPPDKEGMVHFAGFVALMVLMVFVMYNDIMRLFG